MILADLQSRLAARLGEDPAAGPPNLYYGPVEQTDALNACQRIFVLLTLCLEATETVSLSTNVAFYSMLSILRDWLLPLRIRNGNGTKLKPARLADMAALDSSWSTRLGAQERYALVGFDLLAVYKIPSDAETLNITYARCPVDMALPGDSPEIPEVYHPALIDGAIPLLRAKEGGQEWQKTLPLWDRYLGEAEKLANYVRARNKEQGYDYLPCEIGRLDRSRLLAEVTGAK